MENCTVGFSTFRKLYLRVFQFSNFYISGASVLQKLNCRVVKNGVFYTLGLGVIPNILTPPPPSALFVGSPPWGSAMRMDKS